MLTQGSGSPDQLSKLQNQIRQAREVIQQLEADKELAIAEVKRQVHEEIQAKDEEVAKVREQVKVKEGEVTQAQQQVGQLQSENQALVERNEKLEKAGKGKREREREK